MFDGKRLRPENFLRDGFAPTMKRAKVPCLRCHDLRHSCATLLHKNGVIAKVVTERLGHAAVPVTLGIRAHVLPEMQREAADLLEPHLLAGG